MGAKRPLLSPQFIQPKPQLGLRRGRPELRHSRPEEGTKAPLGVETGLDSGCVVNMAKEAIYIYIHNLSHQHWTCWACSLLRRP